MKIVITGATGFIGRNLAESFHHDGHNIIATGRAIEIGEKLKQMGIEFYAADICDAASLKGIFSPADCIIHSAALAGDWGKYRDFYNANVIGTRNVISACRYHDIKKIVFISTPSIYYNGKDRLGIAESELLPGKQHTAYSKTKVIAERELAALRQKGFKVIIFRPRAVYGKYDSIIIPRILRMSEKKQFPMINGGRALTDVTYIDNFVDAVRKSLDAPDSTWNEIYNISNGDSITIRDWFSQVLEVFDRPFRPKEMPTPMAMTMGTLMELVARLPFGPQKPVLTRFSVGYMSKSMTMSIEKAREKLGYSPHVSNREGFERYAEWYRTQNPD